VLHKPINRAQLVSALKTVLPSTQSELTTASETLGSQPNQTEELQQLPQLIEKLNQEKMLWEQLRITLKRREIQEFYERLQVYATEHHCHILLAYSQQLSTQIEAFDWHKIPQQIENFSRILQKINSQNH
jgi:HSP90 family molecular chaperone